MNGLNRGYLVTTVLAMIGFAAAVYLLLRPVAGVDDRRRTPATCSRAGVVGILTAYAFVWITQYYTEYKYRPVQSIAEASRTGPATNIISRPRGGHGVHRACPVLVISVGAHGAPTSSASSPCPGSPAPASTAPPSPPWACSPPAPTSWPWTPSARSPTTPAASSRCRSSPRRSAQKTDRLDAVGNTTKALTKGYAIGSAALAAFLLFRAYLDEVMKITGQDIGVDLTRVPGLRGRPPRRDARLRLQRARHQGRGQGRADRHHRGAPAVQGATRGSWRAPSKPDYAGCVDIVTAGPCGRWWRRACSPCSPRWRSASASSSSRPTGRSAPSRWPAC